MLTVYTKSECDSATVAAQKTNSPWKDDIRVCIYIYIYVYTYTYIQYTDIHNRRKLRSQTSDNMDRLQAEQGRGREKRKIRRKKSRRERVRRKKMQMREKVGKSRNTVFFQWFGAPEGRKVGSLKRRVRSQLARWEMKKCTPLWCEAHFQVKMYKTHHVRTIFGGSDVVSRGKRKWLWTLSKVTKTWGFL